MTRGIMEVTADKRGRFGSLGIPVFLMAVSVLSGPFSTAHAQPGSAAVATASLGTAGGPIAASATTSELTSAAGSASAKVLGPVVQVGFEAYSRAGRIGATERAYQDGQITKHERIVEHVKTVAGGVGSVSGTLAGVEAGATVGATVGAVAGPVGAVVGGLVGTAVGCVAGSLAGGTVAEKAVEVVDKGLK